MKTIILKEKLQSWLGDDDLKVKLLLATCDQGYESDFGNAIKEKDLEYATNLLQEIEIYEEDILNLETYNFKPYHYQRIKRFI